MEQIAVSPTNKTQIRTPSREHSFSNVHAGTRDSVFKEKTGCLLGHVHPLEWCLEQWEIMSD